MADKSDDFLTPSNPDYNTPCSEDSEIIAADIVLPFGASLSIVCYIYLLWMFFIVETPLLKRHPTSLAIYKCLIELLFLQQYLWVPFIHTQRFYDDDNDQPPYDCRSSKIAAILAFLSQFALLGSELVFFVISIDMRIAYTNPFSSYKENRKYFSALVLTLSLASAILLISFGPDVYGMSNIGLVWIQSRREDRSPNYPKMVLYYLMAGGIFVYSVWTNFKYNEKGFSKTVSNRMSIMQRSRKFTLGYVGYGSLIFLLEFISFASHSNAVNPLPAYLLSFRGVLGLIVILYSNWNEVTWDLLNPFPSGVIYGQQGLVENIALERLLLQPHLNTALRTEILYFTTQGIMFAAREFRRTADRCALRYRAHQSHSSALMTGSTSELHNSAIAPYDANGSATDPRPSHPSGHIPATATTAPSLSLSADDASVGVSRGQSLNSAPDSAAGWNIYEDDNGDREYSIDEQSAFDLRQSLRDDGFRNRNTLSTYAPRSSAIGDAALAASAPGRLTEGSISKGLNNNASIGDKTRDDEVDREIAGTELYSTDAFAALQRLNVKQVGLMVYTARR